MTIDDITPEIGNILLSYFDTEYSILNIDDYICRIPGFTGRDFQEVQSDMEQLMENNLVVEYKKDGVIADGYRLTAKGRAYFKENT